jgi:O-succinylbenzoic acid--CoA ligase
VSGDFVVEAAARWPDRPALTGDRRSWTYSELDAWVEELARRIRDEDGARSGEVLALTAEPEPQGVAFLFASWRAGLTAAPLSPLLSEPERAQALRALTAVRPPEGRAILWTSGTSGRSRGVVLSEEGLRASAAGAARRLGLGEADRWLLSLSVAHVGGLALVTRSVLLGAELIAIGRFEAERVSDLIDAGRATHLSLVPTQLSRLLDARGTRPAPPTLRCALIGGAHATEGLVRRALDAGWPLALTYGMTEMTSQVTTASPDLVRRKTGSVGAPLEGVEVRIDTGGEIVTRGPTQALGYLGLDVSLADEEGWYHTGDLGVLDEEGHLTVTGRCSERIVTGGISVDPLEIEGVLRAHPAVREACVVGVPDPDWGEKLAAAVVPIETQLDLEAVDAWSRERLGGPKRPRRWLVLDALPLNRNGKVDRAAVLALVIGA